MAGGLTIQQPRNPVLDFADFIAKLTPVFAGSGETRSYQGIDPSVARSSDTLQALLTQRGSSTAQADKVIEDILYRAQLAFAPILGDEKRSGLYNSTVKNQMANEAIARATAAASQVVLEDQQRALMQASQLQQSRNAGSKNQKQKTGPAIDPIKLITGAAIGTGTNMVIKKGIEGVKSIYDKITAPKGVDSGEFTDIADNIYNPDDINFSSGAFDPMHTAGDFGPANFSEAGNGVSAAFTTDDTAALQQIIDSTSVPSISEGTLVAQADTGIMSDAISGIVSDFAPPGSIQDPGGVAVSSLFAPQDLQNAGISFDTAETIGQIGTQKAIEEAAAQGGSDALSSSFELTDTDLFADEVGGGLGESAATEAGAESSGMLGNLSGAPLLAIAQGTVNTVENPELNATSSFLGGPVGLTQGMVDLGSSVLSDTEDVIKDTVGEVGDFIEDTADSIICTEAVRQHLLDPALYDAECAISRKYLHPVVFDGYHRTAAPLVRRMRTSKSFAARMARFAEAWGNFVVHRKLSWRAAFIVLVGIPTAAVVGAVAGPFNLVQFYRDLRRI